MCIPPFITYMNISHSPTENISTNARRSYWCSTASETWAGKIDNTLLPFAFHGTHNSWNNYNNVSNSCDPESKICTALRGSAASTNSRNFITRRKKSTFLSPKKSVCVSSLGSKDWALLWIQSSQTFLSHVGPSQQREGRRLVRKPCLAPDQQVWSRSEKWARRYNNCYRPCFTGYNNIKLVCSKGIKTKIHRETFFTGYCNESK